MIQKETWGESTQSTDSTPNEVDWTGFQVRVFNPGHWGEWDKNLFNNVGDSPYASAGETRKYGSYLSQYGRAKLTDSRVFH